MDVPITTVLESESCRLRFVSVEDIPHVFSATRFDGFNDGMLWDPPKAETELMEPYERNVKAWLEGSAYTFTIELRESNAFVGRIATRRQSVEGVWDLGFWTHPTQQSRGYMTESAAMVIAFCFRELQATKVIACHALWNSSSEKVLKKNGLKFVQYNPQGFLKNGNWVEENKLEIAYEDWKQTPTKPGFAKGER